MEHGFGVERQFVAEFGIVHREDVRPTLKRSFKTIVMLRICRTSFFENKKSFANPTVVVAKGTGTRGEAFTNKPSRRPPSRFRHLSRPYPRVLYVEVVVGQVVFFLQWRVTLLVKIWPIFWTSALFWAASLHGVLCQISRPIGGKTRNTTLIMTKQNYAKSEKVNWRPCENSTDFIHGDRG